MSIKMEISTCHSFVHCKEQGEASNNVGLRSRSFTVNNDDKHETNASTSEEYIGHRHCTLCKDHTTHFSSYRLHGKSLLCNKCGLQQKTLKKWRVTLVAVQSTNKWKASVAISKPTVDAKKSATSQFTDNKSSKSSSSQHNHIVDVGSSTSKNNEQAAPNISQGNILCFHQTVGYLMYFCVAPRILPEGFKQVFRSWSFKLMLKLLNALMEICQAIINQEDTSPQTKLDIHRHEYFLRVLVITSSACLFISVAEIICEIRNCKAKFQRKHYCFYWFYYPGTNKAFRRFTLYVGVISSTFQFGFNLATLLTGESLFEPCPLVFSWCQLVASFSDPGEAAMVNCRTHGICDAICSECVKCHDNNGAN